MMESWKVALLLAFFAPSVLTYKTYNGYKVLRVGPVEMDYFEAFAELEHDPRFDFWSRPRLGNDNLVMVSGDELSDLTKKLIKLDIEFSIFIDDVGPTVSKEIKEHEFLKSITRETNSRNITFERFMEFAEIQAYIDEMHSAYPNLTAVVDLETTFQGRQIRALHLSNGPGKRMVMMDCALHAREWMAPPVCLKTIMELLDNYNVNKELLDLADWWIVPVANPDGYVYSFEKDRFWRKNRKINFPSPCLGVDPNRNYDFYWGGENVSDPCSLTYPGTGPFSEKESRAVGNQLLAQSGNIAIYLAIHSYGEFIPGDIPLIHHLMLLSCTPLEKRQPPPFLRTAAWSTQQAPLQDYFTRSLVQQTTLH
ncbi:carboxypeptidase B1-like isoform X2 [Neocloeon triangulifer]|uniref:carboxypeptidase B1-like isoform X2 n=1 Tax=Neocloeon triangulifer TaxID=2078957 RepID=UPI00286F6032|nr:carboxypeptidase B1-like isoform X2 [Neocloeon triangulifer]